jgi:hypothetical protein
MATLDERDRTSKSGGNPGLTPVDDIQSGSRIAEDVEPDSTTGRTRALENVKIPKTKNRSASGTGRAGKRNSR